MIDLSKYQFSIIYSVDVPKGVRLTWNPPCGGQYFPPQYQKLHWQMTESGPSEYDYLEGRWSKGARHRKYCNILTFEQFCDFIEHVGLVVEKCQTMGSLGAPGFGISWAPAVPFNSEEQDGISSAYVTPIPPQALREPAPVLPGMPEDVDMPDWEAVEQAMWDWFDDGAWSARSRAEELLATPA